MEWDDSFIYLHSHHKKEEQNDKQTKSFCNNIQYTVCKVNVTTHCTVLYCTVLEQLKTSSCGQEKERKKKEESIVTLRAYLLT